MGKTGGNILEIGDIWLPENPTGRGTIIEMLSDVDAGKLTLCVLDPKGDMLQYLPLGNHRWRLILARGDGGRGRFCMLLMADPTRPSGSWTISMRCENTIETRVDKPRSPQHVSTVQEVSLVF